MSKEIVVDIEGRHLKLSNLDKVLYPAARIHQGAGDRLLRAHRSRATPTSARPPADHEALSQRRRMACRFYEKNCPEHRPEWVQVAPVWSAGNNKWMNYCLAQDLPTLVWAANLADLELHTSLSLGKDILRPTFLVFDLDPGPPANIVQCCQVGLWIREIFAQLKLQCFAKTSGSKGLQLYVPAEYCGVIRARPSHSPMRLPASWSASILELVVSDMKKALRTGKVLVDWSQNDDHKTTICVYSLTRPRAADGFHSGEVGRGRELPQERRRNAASFRVEGSAGAGEETRRPVRAGAEVEAEAAAAGSVEQGRKRRHFTGDANGIGKALNGIRRAVEEAGKAASRRFCKGSAGTRKVRGCEVFGKEEDVILCPAQ